MEKAAYNTFRAFQILFMTLCFHISLAQENVPPLERTISIELVNHTIPEALKKMEQTGGYSFAYRTDLVDNTFQLNRKYEALTTREILDDLFHGRLTYRSKGNYIVLKKKVKPKEQEFQLEGYIYDVKTGKKIPFASIYDTVSLVSTVSDQYGHYSITEKRRDGMHLVVRKVGYRDTIIQLEKLDGHSSNIGLQSDDVIKETEMYQDTTSLFERVRQFKLTDEQRANLDNFRDRLKRKSQVSLVPGVGTNGRLSSVTSVDYSINVLGGFNGGVRRGEVGGLFNIVWDSVKYFQAAGVFNKVGGPVEGIQIAGVTNLNNSTFRGAQFSGTFNLVLDDFTGSQFCGFTNIVHGRVTGAQVAGFWNHKEDSSQAVQIAGFGNHAHTENSGAQVAGFMNAAGRGFYGVQVAGFSNHIGRNATGGQIAGFINTSSNNYEGFQLAGFINVARKMKGVQIAPFNFNDSIDGVSLGFFSFSRKGLHQLEVSANEVLPLNLTFKTGTHKFYNSFTSGVKFASNQPIFWSLGYGIGSSVRLAPKSRLFFDLQSSQILREGTASNFRSLNKLTISYEYQPVKNIALAIGPSFNLFMVNQSSTEMGQSYTALAPYNFYNHTSANDMNTQMWVGGHVALRFF